MNFIMTLVFVVLLATNCDLSALPLIFPRLQKFNETSFDEWVDEAKAPALSSSLKLYNELLELGFHIIVLTGRSEFQRNSTEANLLLAGYRSWEKLILRYFLHLLCAAYPIFF
jgi:hypothetical protein